MDSITMHVSTKTHQYVCKGSFINDVRRFLTIIDPPTPPNVRFLPYKRSIFWVIFDPLPPSFCPRSY